MLDPQSLARWLPSPFLRVSAAAHVAALAALPLSPSAWPWIAAGVVADHAVIAAAGVWPRSRLLGPNLRRSAELAAGAAVALTFDDGPDPAVTPHVLELLARRGARATFFCVGRRAVDHPRLVEAIAGAGHGIGNHTWSHPNGFALMRPSAIEREIDRAQGALAGLARQTVTYFRAPAGIRSPLLEPLLAARGLRLVSWTRRGFDTVTRDPQVVARRIVANAVAGDVLLLHDGNAARDREGRPVALAALALILDGLAQRGLRALPLPA